jgi:hypothetical protein
MLVPVVAPKQRVVPRQTEAEDSVQSRHVFFCSSESLSKAGVGLCYGPEFERIVEFVEPRDLEPAMANIIEGVLR